MEKMIGILLVLLTANCNGIPYEYQGVYENVGFVVETSPLGKNTIVPNFHPFNMCEVLKDGVVMYAYSMFFPGIEYSEKILIKSYKIVKFKKRDWLIISFRDYPSISLYISRDKGNKYYILLQNTQYKDLLSFDVAERCR